MIRLAEEKKRFAIQNNTGIVKGKELTEQI